MCQRKSVHPSLRYSHLSSDAASFSFVLSAETVDEFYYRESEAPFVISFSSVQ